MNEFCEDRVGTDCGDMWEIRVIMFKVVYFFYQRKYFLFCIRGVKSGQFNTAQEKFLDLYRVVPCCLGDELFYFVSYFIVIEIRIVLG